MNSLCRDVDTNLLKILNLDLKIEENLIKDVTFHDKKIEESYRKFHPDNGIIADHDGDCLIIIGWFSILVYAFHAYYRRTVFITCIIFMLISFSLLMIKKNFKNNSTKMKFNYLQVFLYSIYLNFKCHYLNGFFNPEENKGEILRILIYDFITSNLVSLLMLDENLTIRLILLLVNLFSMFLSYINSSSENYHIDAITSLCYSVIFYALKKRWEYMKRSTFAERYSIEKLLDYSNDFIRELNGLHFNRNNKEILISGRNMRDVFSDFFNEDEVKIYNNNLQDETPINSVLISYNDNYYQFYFKSLIQYRRRDLINENDSESVSLLEKIDSIQSSGMVKNKFINLGIFYVKYSLNLTYYEVFYRKYFLNSEEVIDDIFLYDASNFILAQQKIDEESNLRQKVFSKISQEFKIPVYSITQLIENIKDCMNDNNKLSAISYLNTVNNISKYLVYLTNDIIQYSSVMNLKVINIKYEKVYIKEIVEFGYQMLICLLNTSKDKLKNIKPLIFYDSNIDDLNIYSDDIRLKQILLNLVLNSVNSTNNGTILINAKKDSKKNRVLVSISDSSFKMKTEDKFKPFEDSPNNSSGTVSISSETGVSMSKNLAKNLDIKIFSKSHYRYGTKFFLAIPYKVENIRENNFTNKIGLSNIYEQEHSENDFSPLSSEFIKFKKNMEDKSLENDLLESPPEIKLNSDLQECNLTYEAVNCFKPDSSKEIKINQNFRKYTREKENKFFSDKTMLSFNLSSKKIEKNISNQESSEFSLSNSDDEIEEEPQTEIKAITNSIYPVSKRKKIITIDDNYFINKEIKIFLEKIIKEKNIDYEILSGSDGIDILNYVREYHYKENLIKCIITDDTMGLLNGSQAIKIIRELEKQGKVHPINIITITNFEDVDINKLYPPCHNEIILKKPLKIDELKIALNHLKVI